MGVITPCKKSSLKRWGWLKVERGGEKFCVKFSGKAGMRGVYFLVRRKQGDMEEVFYPHEVREFVTDENKIEILQRQYFAKEIKVTPKGVSTRARIIAKRRKRIKRILK